MAAVLPSASFSLLEGDVDMRRLTGEPGQEWARIKCDSKKAYGCGEHGQVVVEGLTLYLRHDGGPVLTSSSLAIRMSDDALRGIEAEIGAPSNPMLRRRGVQGGGIIKIVNQELILIILMFDRQYRRNIRYYLVYDDIDASLSMISYPPDHVEHDWSETPALRRTTPYGGGYELVLMMRDSPAFNHVLCLCTPEARTNPETDSIRLWPMKVPLLAKELLMPFAADLMFAFKGMAFWANLWQGLAYCDLGTSESSVEFKFIKLPDMCLLGLEEMPNDAPILLTRTMGCVGDSVWLICITRSSARADDLVTMWTLDLTERQWRKEQELSSEMVWGLDGFKEAGLPKAPLMYPALSTDGVLCIMLLDERNMLDNSYAPKQDLIFSFDVRSRRLLWHGLIRGYDSTWPLFLPSNFFKRGLISGRKRKSTAEQLLESKADNGSSNALIKSPGA